MKDTALPAQLLSKLFAVQSMKTSAITLKYDLIISLTSEIATQEPDAAISDVVQAVILMRSLPQQYDTTIEILTKRDRFPKLFEVFQSARTTETELAEPEENMIDLEVANAVVKKNERQKKECWVCHGDHVKPRCPKWLLSNEGKNYKASGLKWHQWQEKHKTKAEQANAIRTASKTAKFVRYSDSESESEISTYLCASTSLPTSKISWGLDTMCSCHLTLYKDVFIGNILPISVPIEVANGTTIYSAGKGDV